MLSGLPDKMTVKVAKDLAQKELGDCYKHVSVELRLPTGSVAPDDMTLGALRELWRNI